MALPAVLEQGSGETAVFLLHGVGGGKEVWRDTLAALAGAGYHALAWDMPGYGQSETLDPYTAAALAGALRDWVRQVGAARSVLLGHSMGGMVAQEAMALYPQQFQALVLSGTSAAFGKPGGLWQQQFLRERFAPLDAGMGMAALAEQLVPGMLGPDASAGALDAARALMARVPEATYRSALAAIVQFDRFAELPAIRVPTLCLAGEHDRNAPPAVLQKMAARLAHARYHCLPGVGHLANLEQPERFNAAVLEFLQQAFAPPENS